MWRGSKRRSTRAEAGAAAEAEAATTKRARLLPSTPGGTGRRDARALEVENANLSSWLELLVVDKHLDMAAQ